ncbi:MAG TPA: aspartate aminotransferase family protein [Gammaproteobacteria bacterium]|nr:aspartate aminotransferase family protein [Gammaproteobacteria bacterium]
MENHLVHAYNQLPIQLERGEGCYVYDTKGNKYLDAYCGIAVTILGHNYAPVTKTIQNQAAKIIHTSNLVEIPQQMELSNLLVGLFGTDAQVFFNNSGSEAVETALKLAHLYGHSKNIDNPKIIVMEGAFHGRTMGCISAGWNPKYQEGFGPLLPGFVRVKYNDINAIEDAVKADKDIVAVMLEPVQGESGVVVPNTSYLNEVRLLCDEHKLLMIDDEIQAGMARTGKFFCFEHNEIKPDVVTLAKGLANGLPIAACIIRKPFCDLFKPGSHGSTFGGNPLSCAAAITTVNEIVSHKFYENAARQGAKIIKGLNDALIENPHVKQVRGKGLFIGIELDRPCRDILNIALKHNILFNIAGTNVMRFLPALNINDEQAQTIIDTVPKIIEEYYAQA